MSPPSRTTALPHALRQAIDLVPRAIMATPALVTAASRNMEAWGHLRWRPRGRPSFVEVHRAVAARLEPAEHQALGLYLSLHAATIASSALLWARPIPAEQNEGRFSAIQAMAGAALLTGLVDPTVTEPEVRQRALVQIRHSVDARTASAFAQVWKSLPQSPVTLKTDGEPHPDVQQFLVAGVAEVRNTLRDSPTTPVVRLLATLSAKVAAFCRERGLPNHTRDVSIGDVDPTGLPPDIRERMALDPFGPKSIEVAARAYAYRTLFQQGGIDWQRYDLTALGWPPLREHFLDYARRFSLYPPDINPAENLISAGGQHGIAKALLIARRHLQANGVQKPSVYFSNPGLRMIATMGRFLGFEVLEPTASPDHRFFPDAASVARELAANPDCRIFILTPMGNPNGGIADVEEVTALLKVLKERNVVVVTDFAYLGTGSVEHTERLCKVLADYPLRLDVIAMTKFFGRPALRCSSVMTPDAALATQFKSIAQDFQPSESYAMQAEALALWELVSWEDRRALAELFLQRQARLIERLHAIDTKRIADGRGSLINPAQPIVGDASLYVFGPLADGIDALNVIEETGLIGVPAAGFFASGQTGYMRFAVGIEEI